MERGVLTVMEKMHTNVAPGELFELAQIVAQVDPSKITHLRGPGLRSATSAAPAWCSRTSTGPPLGDDARDDAT